MLLDGSERRLEIDHDVMVDDVTREIVENQVVCMLLQRWLAETTSDALDWTAGEDESERMKTMDELREGGKDDGDGFLIVAFIESVDDNDDGCAELGLGRDSVKWLDDELLELVGWMGNMEVRVLFDGTLDTLQEMLI